MPSSADAAADRLLAVPMELQSAANDVDAGSSATYAASVLDALRRTVPKASHALSSYATALLDDDDHGLAEFLGYGEDMANDARYGARGSAGA
ncbi:hypothetical protein [Indioceanicola profundi]|uniref:hypothetical protein n=1 Tax=Indioceanicola profundi TaxID=2220096 RepID=UPI000E6AA628|nr:hypothetical protein [Indioceanicola profundi]